MRKHIATIATIIAVVISIIISIFHAEISNWYFYLPVILILPLAFIIVEMWRKKRIASLYVSNLMPTILLAIKAESEMTIGDKTKIRLWIPSGEDYLRNSLTINKDDNFMDREPTVKREKKSLLNMAYERKESVFCRGIEEVAHPEKIEYGSVLVFPIKKDKEIIALISIDSKKRFSFKKAGELTKILEKYSEELKKSSYRIWQIEA